MTPVINSVLSYALCQLHEFIKFSLQNLVVIVVVDVVDDVVVVVSQEDRVPVISSESD